MSDIKFKPSFQKARDLIMSANFDPDYPPDPVDHEPERQYFSPPRKCLYCGQSLAVYVVKGAAVCVGCRERAAHAKEPVEDGLKYTYWNEQLDDMLERVIGDWLTWAIKVEALLSHRPPDMDVIFLYSRKPENPCKICGFECDGFQGVPVWNGYVVAEDWPHEWGGVRACSICFRGHAEEGFGVQVHGHFEKT